MSSTTPSKEWMNAHPSSEEFFKGVASFLKFTKENSKGEIWFCCPCIKCRNYSRPMQTLEIIAEHLFCDGIDKSYTTWINHGEPLRRRSVNVGVPSSSCHDHNEDAFPKKVFNDTFGHVHPDDLDECLKESQDENDVQALDDSSGRTGSARIAKKRKKERPTPIGEINRIGLNLETHTKKDGSCCSPFMSQTKVTPVVVSSIRGLATEDPNLGQKDLDHDSVVMVSGGDGKVHACGMVDGVSETAIHASATCKENTGTEIEQLEILKNEINTLKKAYEELSLAQKSLQEQVATLKKMMQSTPRSMQECSEFYSTCQDQLKKHSPDLESLSDLPSKTCLLLNLLKKIIALGRVNVDAAPSMETYNILVDGIFEKEEYFCDREKKFKDIMKGDLVNWPKPYVHFLRI